jgi:uncharacterized protein (DUF2062 family)
MTGKIQPNKQPFKPIESLAIGAAAGCVGFTVNLPFWATKMRSQCNLPYTLDPRILYRGYTTGLTLMVPITSFQVFNTSRVENFAAGSTVSPKHKILASFMGGALVSIITNPLNLIGTQQHKHNYLSPYKTFITMTNHYGIRSLFIGAPVMAITEGLFVTSFYGMFPFFKPYLEKHTQNKYAVAFGAAVLSALPTTIITHPLDRLRAMQHQFADEKKKHEVKNCIKELYQNNRSTFFKGLIPRTAGTVCTVLAMGTTIDLMQSYKS